MSGNKRTRRLASEAPGACTPLRSTTLAWLSGYNSFFFLLLVFICLFVFGLEIKACLNKKNASRTCINRYYPCILKPLSSLRTWIIIRCEVFFCCCCFFPQAAVTHSGYFDVFNIFSYFKLKPNISNAYLLFPSIFPHMVVFRELSELHGALFQLIVPVSSTFPSSFAGWLKRINVETFPSKLNLPPSACGGGQGDAEQRMGKKNQGAEDYGKWSRQVPPFRAAREI